MDTYKLRKLFTEFLKSENFTNLVLDNSATIDQEPNLKYQRIDRYKVMVLSRPEIKKLLRFCVKHDLDLWIGGDKICVGYNYRTTCGCELARDHLENINNSVLPEISAAVSMGDRIEPDHHLDVHGGLD